MNWVSSSCIRSQQFPYIHILILSVEEGDVSQLRIGEQRKPIASQPSGAVMEEGTSFKVCSPQGRTGNVQTSEGERAVCMLQRRGKRQTTHVSIYGDTECGGTCESQRPHTPHQIPYGVHNHCAHH